MPHYILELAKFLESIRRVFAAIVGSQELDLSVGLVFNHLLSVLEYLQYPMLVVHCIRPIPYREVIHEGHKPSLSSQGRILCWALNIYVIVVEHAVSLMRTTCKLHTHLFS